MTGIVRAFEGTVGAGLASAYQAIMGAMRILFGAVAMLLAVQAAFAEGPQLRLPARRAGAIGGSAFAKEIVGLPQEEREERIWREVVAGNVPDYLRQLVAVPLSAAIADRTITGRIFVAPDYLAIGSNEDYFFVPLTPYTAQRIADRLQCTLPTPQMVDSIHQAVAVKLVPSPIPPTPAMTTVPVFVTHNETVFRQRTQVLSQFPLGSLVAGDKKDLVICKSLADSPGRVAIYGWHKPDGKAIQPLYLGHFAYWADYSHGTRLVDRMMEVDGKPMPVEKVLADPNLCALLSGEGPVPISRYNIPVFPHPDDPTIHVPSDERLQTFSPIPGVRVVIDEPAELQKNVRLVLFALPNGNTIEQTFGRRLKPGDDWHYDIQHIGAQTRFVRQLDKDESLVVAYLEANNHAWPTWLRSSDSSVTVRIVDSVVNRYSGHDLRIALDSHSGGGAFEFAYINSVSQIPAQIDRIAFLDSEYNYEAALHESKLAQWLRTEGHYLCAIAYDDASARYQGKPFVSAEGGTWGRTHAMLRDLGADFGIKLTNTTDPERYEGPGGRIVFLLKQNPRAEIFHTVQVERNGFIESLLSGTAFDGRGFRYFASRAYLRFIHE